MLEIIAHTLIHIVHSMGYAGIFVMAAIQSTFIPLGIEFTLVPAGYLIYQGHLSFPLVFLSSVAGSICGSLINYFIAARWGRKFLLRYQKLFMIDEKKLAKLESFFTRHGAFAVFIGRLMYGIRHYISFPAGLARMDLKKFCVFTAAGDALCVLFYLGLGYAAGGNETELHAALPIIKIAILALVVGAVFFYMRKHKIKKRRL